MNESSKNPVSLPAGCTENSIRHKYQSNPQSNYITYCCPECEKHFSELAEKYTNEPWELPSNPPEKTIHLHHADDRVGKYSQDEAAYSSYGATEDESLPKTISLARLDLLQNPHIQNPTYNIPEASTSQLAASDQQSMLLSHQQWPPEIIQQQRNQHAPHGAVGEQIDVQQGATATDGGRIRSSQPYLQIPHP